MLNRSSTRGFTTASSHHWSVGSPAGAVFFGAKDFCKRFLADMGVFTKEERTVIAVILANFPYWLLRNPSEVLKTRGQVKRLGAVNTSSHEAAVLPDSIAGPAKHQQQRLDNNNSVSRITSISLIRDSAATVTELYNSYASNILYALPADVIKFVACKQDKEVLLYSLVHDHNTLCFEAANALEHIL